MTTKSAVENLDYAIFKSVPYMGLGMVRSEVVSVQHSIDLTSTGIWWSANVRKAPDKEDSVILSPK